MNKRYVANLSLFDIFVLHSSLKRCIIFLPDGRKKGSFVAHSASALIKECLESYGFQDVWADVPEIIRLETLFYATCPVTSLTSIFRM